MSQLVLTEPTKPKVEVIKLDLDNKNILVKISDGENVDILSCLELNRANVCIEALILENCKKVHIPHNMVIGCLVVQADNCEVNCEGIVGNIVVYGSKNRINIISGDKCPWSMGLIEIRGGCDNIIEDKGSSVVYVEEIKITGDNNRVSLPKANILFVNFTGSKNGFISCNTAFVSKHWAHDPLLGIKLPMFKNIIKYGSGNTILSKNSKRLRDIGIMIKSIPDILIVLLYLIL